MSVTVVVEPATTSIARTIADYDIHVTSKESCSESIEEYNSSVNDRPRDSAANPGHWPLDHRRIPAYRPVDRHLDVEERPGGSNPIEHVFIFTMLNGVGIIAVTAKIWGKTGGRYFDQVFRFKVGGEW